MSEKIFNVSIFLAIAYLMWMPITWLLIRFITPKNLIQRYFKEPHFTRAELTLFDHFPGSLIRTGILMTLCVWPQKGKKRQATDIRDHAAGWFIMISKVFTFFSIGHALLFVFLLFSSGIYILYFKN